MTKSIISIIFILLTLTILSCQNGKNEQYEKENKQPKINIVEQKSTQLPQIENTKNETIQRDRKDSLDITLIGKTTQELNKYKFHTCLGAVLESEKYAVAIYSLNVGNCHNGKNKIVFEKFINYYEQGKANFEIIDELIVKSNFPKKCYSTIALKLDKNKSERNYLIEYEDNSKEMLTKIYKLWEINLSTEKFIEIELPKNFICHNPDYADGI